VRANGLIYLTTGHTAGLIAVKAGLTGDLTKTGVAWRMPRAAPTRPSPLVLGELLFMVNDTGTASCLDATTGRVVWKESLDGKFSASPVFAGGNVYFTSETGKTFVVAADREFKLIETNRLDAGCLASPAVVDGAIFLRTKTHLYCIGK
ncbi:MAG TPA: PQQ-binding-like beta-propeller repeat protein, partial [Fimbriiglobus sp.]|nr:PQQ-binding-like beta-propeller repeat protein [Fimbriiglobus sp.]